METSSRLQLLLPVILVLGLAGAFLIGTFSIFSGIDLSSIIYDEQLARVMGLRASSDQTYPQRLPLVREVRPGEGFELPVDYSVYPNFSSNRVYRELGFKREEIRSIAIPVIGWRQDQSDESWAEAQVGQVNGAINIECLQDCRLLEQVAAYDVLLVNDEHYLTVLGSSRRQNQHQANTIRINWRENYILAAKI